VVNVFGSYFGERRAVMKTFKKILFPVDFSDVSPKIAPWVRMVAEKFKAEIHLLFVVRRLAYFSDVYVTPVSIEKFEGEVIKGGRRRWKNLSRPTLKNTLPLDPKFCWEMRPTRFWTLFYPKGLTWSLWEPMAEKDLSGFFSGV
jgi:hypothetical protein